MGYIGRGPVKSGAFRIIDDVSSSFNGSTTAFTLQSSSSNITPGTEQNLLVAVDGVVQEPQSAFTISGSTLTFTSAPASGASFWGVELGDVGGIAQTIANGTVDSSQIVNGSIDTAHIGNLQITNALMADDAVNSDELAAGAVDIAHLSATGSASSSTFLRGDNSWAAAGATVLDEDDMATNSATAVASQQSVKAYVDARAKIKSGSFSGDAQSTQSITGVGFKPLVIFLSKRCNAASCNEAIVIAWKDAVENAGGSGTGRSGTWWSGDSGTTQNWADDGIRSFDNDGFTVGLASENYLAMNGSGNTYTYVAIG